MGRKADPTFHILKIFKDAEGRMIVSRSIGVEAVAIAADLAPDEFPLPVVSAPPAPPVNTPATTGAYTATAGISQPTLVRKVEPEYTEEARQAHLAGMVRLQCVVGTDGKPREFRVIQSLGLGLDENAILAVEKWLFEPGRRAGEPVNVIASVEVTFRLLDDKASDLISWHLARAEFNAGAGTARPVVTKSAAPRAVAGASHATATLSFVVDAQGSPVDLKVESNSDSEWASEVVGALSKWKFSPGRKFGTPVPVAVKMDFIRGN
jgi:TonB family protein